MELVPTDFVSVFQLVRFVETWICPFNSVDNSNGVGTAPFTLMNSRLQCGSVETDGIIRRQRVGEDERAAAQWVGRQRNPVLQIGAGGNHRVGTSRPCQREPELLVGKTKVPVGGHNEEWRRRNGKQRLCNKG